YRFVFVAPDVAAREALTARLDHAGVARIIPIERYELLHRYMNLEPENYPVSERLADLALSIPLYPGLSEAEVETVCGALRRAA
ncbi:MAG: DegT/DnrJ/EryC1/StrS family aminotransferase, partial [Afipia sp.]|nr:DegT/DnrJ/EryC1/StrS family aminotransferase [Afipia sp.]